MVGQAGPLPSDGELVGGAYRVVATIGQGGMGTVYRAVDVASGRQVALKLMLPHLVTPVRMARFAREAEVTARLDRLGGIVRVFASGVHRGAPYFAMELVEGEDLEALLERGPLPVERAVGLVERIARTMGACHGEGVVHRDLKPGNVLLDALGPKIVDFGLALDESAEQRLTKTGELVGTPFYMPPEQLAGRPADARADVYALGAILYHALTGQPPFLASTLVELAARLNTSDPARPSKLRPGVPPDLDAVCLRALARRAEGRYADAGELADDLARVQRRERPTASTHTGSWVDVSGIFARARRGDRRAQLLVGGLGLTALLAIVGAGLAVGVVAPRRAALAELHATLEWDGDRCERSPERCQGGAHVLARWDLGAGEGPAPSLADLAAHAAAAERAGARLAAAEGLLGRSEALRLAALARLVDVDGHPTDGAARSVSGPTATLVQAVEARRRGEVAVAVDQLARVLAQEPGWPAALRLQARLWEDRLALGRRPTVVQELSLWLDARGRRDEDRALARQAAVRGLVRWYLEALALAAGSHGDPVTIRTELEAALAGARQLDALPAVLEAVAQEKVAALEACAEAWGRALSAAAPAERAAVARLGAVVRAEPAVVPGPRLLAALGGVLDGLIDAAERAPSDETIVRAAALDDAIAAEVSSSWRTPAALAELVLVQTEGGHRVNLEGVDLALTLTFLRTAPRRGQALDTVLRRAGPRQLALAETRPRSLIARAARLIVALTGRTELRTGSDQRRLREVVALADAVLAPGVVVDLAPVYAAEVEYELAWVRWCQMKQADRDRDPAASARFAAEVRAHARRCRELVDPARVDTFKDAWALEIEAECAASTERGLAAVEAATASMRARVERTQRGGKLPDGLNPLDEREQLVKLLLIGAGWVDAVARVKAGEEGAALRERSRRWGDEALSLTRTFDGRGPGTAGMAVAYVAGRARQEGRLDEAEALVTQAPELFAHSPELTEEACLVARARGDEAAFEERLRTGLERFPRYDPLHALRQERQRGR